MDRARRDELRLKMAEYDLGSRLCVFQPENTAYQQIVACEIAPHALTQKNADIFTRLICSSYRLGRSVLDADLFRITQFRPITKGWFNHIFLRSLEADERCELFFTRFAKHSGEEAELIFQWITLEVSLHKTVAS